MQTSQNILEQDTKHGEFLLLEDGVPCANGITFNLLLRWTAWRGMEMHEFCIFLRTPRRELRAFVARVEEDGLVAVLTEGNYTLRPIWSDLEGKPPLEQVLLKSVVEHGAPGIWEAALRRARPEFLHWAVDDIRRYSPGSEQYLHLAGVLERHGVPIPPKRELPPIKAAPAEQGPDPIGDAFREVFGDEEVE